MESKRLKKKVIGMLLAIIMILQIILPTVSVYAAEGLVDVKFADKNLYNKVKGQLEARTDLSVLHTNDAEFSIQVANEDINKITELNLQGSKNKDEDVIKSLKGLESLIGLQKLHLAQNKLTSDANLSVLDNLTNLIDLDLSENHIEDVSSIPNLIEKSKNGSLMLKLTGQIINYIEIVNKIAESEEQNTTSIVKLPQIFDYAYSKGEEIEVDGYNAIKYIKDGGVYLKLGVDTPLRTETEVANVPTVNISINSTEDGQEGSTFNTTCYFKYIVIDGDSMEGIIFHEEGNLYYGVKEQLTINGKNKNGEDYKEIISPSNKYFDNEKVMVINKVDILNDITLLDVKGKGVQYLKGINHFVGLEDLILEDNYIQDATLIRKLVENKTGKLSELSNILSTKISDFSAEYQKLSDYFDKYTTAIEEKVNLQKELKDPTISDYAQKATRLEQVKIDISTYNSNIKDSLANVISSMNNINNTICIDEIIGLKKETISLKENIELIQDGIASEELEDGTIKSELDEIKSNIKNIYKNVTDNIQNLTREELGYLTNEEWKNYLNNKVNELSSNELEELVIAYGKMPNVFEFDIVLPQDADYGFEFKLEPCTELLGVVPSINAYYGEVSEVSGLKVIKKIVVSNTPDTVNNGEKIAHVAYAIPDTIPAGTSLTTTIKRQLGDPFDTNTDGSYVINLTDEVKSYTVLNSSATSIGSGIAGKSRSELITIIQNLINSITEETELTKFEKIVNVVEIKHQELSNVNYYDEHEVLYELRSNIEKMTTEDLRKYATSYNIALTGVEDAQVKQTIIEKLETLTREVLIEILREENLRDKLAVSDKYYDKTGTELIVELSISSELFRFSDLLTNDEKELYKKFTLIDSILKELKELNKESKPTTKDDFEIFKEIAEREIGITLENNIYKKTVSDTEVNKEYEELSKEEALIIIERYLSDNGTIEKLVNILNSMIAESMTKYITSTITDERLLDLTLDYKYSITTGEETKEFTIHGLIAERLNEKIKDIDKFNANKTLEVSKWLFNYTEPVAGKSRYLVTYLNNLTPKDLDEGEIEIVKTKLDGINTRLKTDNLKTLKELTVLDLSQNEMLVNVEPLASLTTLKVLNLAKDYMIDDIEKLNINAFEKLEILNLSGLGLTNINISGLSKLKCLDLSNNNLKNIDNVQIVKEGDNAPFENGNLSSLIHLDLSKNNINNIEKIVESLNMLTRYQSSNNVNMILPFDVNRDLRLYAQQLSTNIKATNTSRNKVIDLPLIYRQIEEIQGIQVSFDGNTNNSGRQVALPTNELGNFTKIAQIVGGIAAGTTFTVNYTVTDKDEQEKIPVESIFIQEEEILKNENASKPDLNADEKLTEADRRILIDYMGKTEFPVTADIIPDGVINGDDYDLLTKYIEGGWVDNNLSNEQREKAKSADINGDNIIDNEDLKLLGLKVLGKETTGNFSNADIDGNNVIEAKDMILLSKYIASKSSKKVIVDILNIEAPVGEYKPTAQLYANVLPENATDKRVTWVSQNENIVRVDENGKVSSVGEGTTRIVAISKANPTIYKEIPVNVNTPVDVVTEIKIQDGIKTEYKKGEQLDLTNAKLEITKRNTGKQIVDLTEDMVNDFTTENVTDELVVTVIYKDAITNSEAQTTFKVKVVDYDPTTDIVKEIKLVPPTKLEYNKNDELDLAGATVEKVMESGVKQTPVAVTPEMISGYDKTIAGKQIVTVTFEGKTATFEVMVNNPVTGVSLNKTEESITKGGTIKLNATVNPEDAVNKNVTWSSSDASIATVDSSGNVTAVDVGEAIITVTTVDGEKTAECKVIVKDKIYEPKELENGTICITGINPDTTKAYFIDKFNSEYTCKIYKNDGTTELLSDTDIIGTGYKLKMFDSNNTVIEEQILVVKGDVNGDGEATETDSGSILSHRTGKNVLENEYLLAADINGDGTVDGIDSVLLIYHRFKIKGYRLQNN